MRVPLIKPDGVLDEKERLLRQERRAQCGSEVELMQEHSDHLQVKICEVQPSHWIESTMPDAACIHRAQPSSLSRS